MSVAEIRIPRRVQARALIARMRKSGSDTTRIPAGCGQSPQRAEQRRSPVDHALVIPHTLALRVHAIQHPWEGNRFADVMRTGNPRSRALDPHAEPAMRDAPVATQIDIPLIVIDVQPVFTNAALEQRRIVDPL